jgi:hypothetical protein
MKLFLEGSIAGSLHTYMHMNKELILMSLNDISWCIGTWMQTFKNVNDWNIKPFCVTKDILRKP